jgi:hypothetical protein
VAGPRLCARSLPTAYARASPVSGARAVAEARREAEGAGLMRNLSRTQREKLRERRLEEMGEAVAAGRLEVRQATEAERAQWEDERAARREREANVGGRRGSRA